MQISTTPLARRTALAALLCWMAAASGIGCATPSTPGPAFAPATDPAAGHARIYVFRVDHQHSLSRVEIGFDRNARGHLGNGEYATFELPSGPHRLEFRQRGLAFVSFGWNHQDLVARAGETIYLEISVRISGQAMPGSGRDLEIPGRGGGAASENVFVQRRSPADAIAILADTTLHIE